jgi:hypothetical protein
VNGRLAKQFDNGALIFSIAYSIVEQNAQACSYSNSFICITQIKQLGGAREIPKLPRKLLKHSLCLLGRMHLVLSRPNVGNRRRASFFSVRFGLMG